MAVIATLTFDSHLGHNTQYELDILDAGFSGTPISLIGASEPITITWHKDRDAYKPLLGSSANIQIFVQNQTQLDALPDFNDGDERQYEVRLRYRDADNNLQDFWCGYIDPVASTEQFTNFPIPLRFNCVDGLGRLEELTLDRDVFITGSDIADQIPVWDYVTRTLRQTGLELPIYVDSGIRTSDGDALTTATASAFSFFGEDVSDRREALTYKEALEGTLTTFNCRVFQSAGAWWVVNCSTHGGTGDSETASFQRWVPDTNNITDYVRDTDDADDVVSTSFNLRKNLTNSSTTDVSVLDRDLHLTTRPRVGSYEARPRNLIQRPLHVNDDFRNQAEDWRGPSTGTLTPAYSGTLPSGYETVNNLTFANDSASDVDDEGNAWSMVTNRNRQIIDSRDELWFETSAPFQVHRDTPTEVEVRWKTDNVSTSGRDPVSRRIPIRVRLDLDSSVTVNILDTSSISSLLMGGQEATVSTLYWNFSLERWVTGSGFQSGNRGRAVNGTMSNDTIRGGDEGTWYDVNFTVDAFSTFDGFFEDTELPGGSLTVEFYYPQSTRNGRKVNTENDTNRFRTFVDLVKVTDAFESEQTDPVYEHVAYTTAERDEVVATRTERYEPAFISSGVDTFRQYLSADSYWRSSETSADGASLENKVTLQKLNDFADRFQYYEGSVVNRQAEPLQMHNKLLVSYSVDPQTTSCVMNGGTFSPKFNTWDIFAYIPNQERDIDFGTFFERDVDLVGSLFQGRVNRGRYVLGLDVRGLDDMGNQHQTVDSEGRMPGDDGYVATNDSLVAVPQFLSLEGLPGQEVEGVITLSTGSEFQTEATNLSVLNSDGTAFTGLDFIEFGDLTSAGDTISLQYTATLPRRAEYEQVRIQGEVDPVTEDTVSLTIDISSTDSAGVVSLSSITISGEAGSIRTFQIPIQPTASRELVEANFAATLSDGLINAGVVQSGVGLLFSVTANIPNMAPATNKTVVITNVDDQVRPSGQTRTVTLNFSETEANFSLSATTYTIEGLPSNGYSYFVRANPAPGYRLNDDNDNTSSDNTAVAAIGDAIADGNGYLIPITGTIPSDDTTVAITADYTGDALRLDADFVTTRVGFTVPADATFSIDEPSAEDFENGVNTTGYNTLLVIPDAGQKWNGVDDLTLTFAGNVSQVSKMLLADGTISVRYQITFGAADSLTGNTISFAGTTVNEPYLATINITENLPNGRLVTSTLTQRFSMSDSTLSFTGVTISPATQDFMYGTSTTFTLSPGGTASNYSYSSGSVSFDLSVALPTFSSTNPIGDVTIDVSITGTGANSAGLAPATTAVWGNNIVEVGYEAQTIDIGWSANGTVGISVVTANGASGDGLPALQGTNLAGEITFSLPAVTSNTDHTFAIFASDNFDSLSGAISVLTFRRRQSVQSTNVSSIDVNIGGTPGTTSGVLYIT